MKTFLSETWYQESITSPFCFLSLNWLEYLDRINDAEADLALINVQIKQKTEPLPSPDPTPVDEKNTYKELLEKLEQLDKKNSN